jgi:hypothetical protein
LFTLVSPNLKFNDSQNDYLTGDPSDFTLPLCIRTEMQNLVGGLKGLVAYDETNIKVDIQLTATLGPLFISADADMRQSVDQQTNVVFPALAWQGDESNICIDEAQHPNEDIRVCVQSK